MTVATAAILRAAAERIETHGWCQRTSKIGDAGCVLYSIYQAAGPDYNLDQRWNAEGAVRQHLGVLSLSHWNDSPSRSKDEVVRLLLEVADREDPAPTRVAVPT